MTTARPTIGRRLRPIRRTHSQRRRPRPRPQSPPASLQSELSGPAPVERRHQPPAGACSPPPFHLFTPAPLSLSFFPSLSPFLVFFPSLHAITFRSTGDRKRISEKPHKRKSREKLLQISLIYTFIRREAFVTPLLFYSFYFTLFLLSLLVSFSLSPPEL